LHTEFLIGAIPLTLCGISYERLRSLPRIHLVRSVFPTWKVLIFTWGVSALLSSPRFLAYEYDTNIYYGNESVIASDALSGFHSLTSNNENGSNAVSNTTVCRKVSMQCDFDIQYISNWIQLQVSAILLVEILPRTAYSNDLNWLD